MTTSTMFLRNITCIDHAWIDCNGFIVGGSKHQEIFVTGAVDEQEQVVVDFSNIKKLLKSWIDDKETGYDHKLWLFTKESNCTWNIVDSTITIVSPQFTAVLPTNAVHIIDGTYYDLDQDMSKYLLDHAHAHYGTSIVDIQVRLSDDQFAQNVWRKTFTYSHGLKNSTSWGCQNPGHGHTSFVELVPKHGVDLDQVVKLLDEIVARLNRRVLVYKENVIGVTDQDFTIKYCTPARGDFLVTYRRTHPHKFFDVETTVENIVSTIVAELQEQLTDAGVETVYISEGLAKGACATL